MFPVRWKKNNPLKLWPLGQNIQEFQVPAGSLAQIAAVTSGLYFYTVKHCEKYASKYAAQITPFIKSVEMPPEIIF